MKSRQKQILITLIDDYINTAQPISSGVLAHQFGLSSATLRLELADLSTKGYLARPHISSGRIPTDKAYRFYVNVCHSEPWSVHRGRLDSESGKNNQLTSAEKRFLRKRINQYREIHQMMRQAVQAVSEISHHLTFNFLERDFFESGLAHLFAEPEFFDHDLVLNVSQFFDMADQIMVDLWHDLEDETTVFIGHENPLKKLPQCSLLSRRYCLPSGQQGLVSILGPKRMDYSRNISLLEYVSELLESRF